MNFGASDPLQDYQISSFAGIDFSTLENKVNMTRSPDCANMAMNHYGYLEKRTGYRRLYQGEGKINGIFDYTPAQANETFYFMHEGTKLYRIRYAADGSIERSELLMDGLADKKTRHFVFGDKLYILGAGYIQIAYNNGGLAYGFVKDIGTDESAAPFAEGANYDTAKKNKTFEKSLDAGIDVRKEKESAAIINAVVSIPSTAAGVKIKSVYVYGKVYGQTSEAWHEWALRYCSISDDGKTVQLLGNPIYGCNANFVEFLTFTKIKVEYYEGIFVDSPLMFINRTAVPLKKNSDYDNIGRVYDYDDYKDTTWTDDTNIQPLDGDAVDSANFANGRRRVQFIVPEAQTAVCAYAFYLTDAQSRARVNKITIDGQTMQSYLNTYVQQYLGGGSSVYAYVDESATVSIDEDGRFVKMNTIIYVEDKNGTVAVETVNTNLLPGSVVEIDYTVLHDVDSDNEQINDCSIYGIYGGNNDTRVFLSGNPKHKNRDYASGLYDATYFPNSMYTDVGSESSAIVGYQKLYANQIIVKDDSAEDASQYLRSLNMDESGNVTYTLLQGNSTYGASCVSSFKQVGGLPFYIGNDGVYTISGTSVQNQNNTTLRSLQINKRFTQEDLTNAVCCRLGDTYIVAAGTHMWLCDTTNNLEWFYYDGLPEITCLLPQAKQLYFGTADGRVCVFNGRDDKNAYYDNLNPDGSIAGATPVSCYWSTPISAFDNWNMLKTIVNVYFACMPYNDSSVHIYYNSSDDIGEDITTEDIALFDFAEINFDKFSFDSIRQPKPFATGVKCKNVFVFGIKLANAQPQPFGIVSVGYKFKYSKYVK